MLILPQPTPLPCHAVLCCAAICVAAAPQYGSAKSVANIAGMVAGNVLRGDHPMVTWDVVDWDAVRADTAALIVDVREVRVGIFVDQSLPTCTGHLHMYMLCGLVLLAMDGNAVRADALALIVDVREVGVGVVQCQQTEYMGSTLFQHMSGLAGFDCVALPAAAKRMHATTSKACVLASTSLLHLCTATAHCPRSSVQTLLPLLLLLLLPPLLPPADLYLLLQPAEVSCGCIPGAVNYPLSSLRDKLQELPQDKKLYVYCQVGRVWGLWGQGRNTGSKCAICVS
jgi:hypothetical protein